MCMTMRDRLTIRINGQQLKLIREHLLKEQKGELKQTKSSLIREVLSEYFYKTCRNHELQEKPEKKSINMDSIPPVHKKLKLIDFK
jgi:hypothetical protein